MVGGGVKSVTGTTPSPSLGQGGGGRDGEAGKFVEDNQELELVVLCDERDTREEDKGGLKRLLALDHLSDESGWSRECVD